MRVAKRMAMFSAIAGISVLVASAAHADLVRIMPVGDSITVGATNLPGQPEVPFEYGYRAGLYTRLTIAGYAPFQFVGGSPQHIAPGPAVFDLAGVNQDYHNGYGGEGINFIATNIRNWIETDNPDLILLMIGINDLGPGDPNNPVNAENRLDSLVRMVVNAKPTAHLIVAQTIPYSTYTPSLIHYNNYIKNTLVPSYQSQGKLVSTVDQYAALLTDGQIDPELYSNGINHPSPIGYDRMAQIWYDGIQALGPIEPTPLPQDVARRLGGVNLLSNKPVVASSALPGFDPSNVVDGSESEHVFSGGGDGGDDADMRLAVHGLSGQVNRIRIWQDVWDFNRIPARVTIKGSAADTASLVPDAYEFTMADVSSLLFNADGYVDIDVNVPQGVASLLFQFGGADLLGSPYGLRIAEIQAFAIPEPPSLGLSGAAIAAMALCRMRRATTRFVSLNPFSLYRD